MTLISDKLDLALLYESEVSLLQLGQLGRHRLLLLPHLLVPSLKLLQLLLIPT